MSKLGDMARSVRRPPRPRKGTGASTPKKGEEAARNARRAGRDPIAYGIDYGTSNSQVAVTYADRVEVVKVEQGPLPENLPSVIYLHRDNNRAAGEEAVRQYLLTSMDVTACRNCDLVHWQRGEADTACRQFRQGNSCTDSRLLVGLKSDLAVKSFTSTHSWGRDFTSPDLVAVVLRRLKQTADRSTGADVRHLVLGHPVLFVGAEGPDAAAAQAVARERLWKAARLAGFDEVELYPEPSAALEDREFSSGTILAADFGGGTFDVAVIRAPRLPGEVAGLAGTPIGGEHFDALLFDAKVAPHLGIDGEFRDRLGKVHRFPARFVSQLRSMRGLRQLLSDPDFAMILKQFEGFEGGDRLQMLDEILYGGFAHEFYAAIERAKIELSSKAKTEIRLEKGRVIDLRIPVTRQEFDALIAADIATIERTVLEALEHAELAPEDVDVVVRTGGSSMIPAFQQVLDRLFGPSKVQERGPFTAIAQGLALHAQAIWSTP